MDKDVYRKGIARQLNLNTQETLAMIATYRPTPRGVEHESRVSYGEGRLNYIKTYCRKDFKAIRKPLFLYIHGGGWISGVTAMRNPYIMNWAELGFFTASVSYSYAPQKVFPTQLKEIFAAIDYIFDNAEKYNIDTDNIVIAGESAGGYFISYVACYGNDPETLKKLGIEFRHAGKLKIKALVSHSGCADLKRIFDSSKKQSEFPFIKMMTATFFGMTEAEFADYLKTEESRLAIPVITPSFPPSYLVWCVKDLLQYESFDMAADLEKAGVDHALYKGDKKIAKHAWSIVTRFKEGRDCLAATYDFVLPYLPGYFEKISGKWLFKS
ncbi:MAG: alpha/beta hydrolase [Clostridia bacterium]|nr:alpha/beta hydrolase [Clostridia bacterium]